MSVILSRGDNRVGGVSSDAVLRREYAKRMTAPGQAVLRRHGAGQSLADQVKALFAKYSGVGGYWDFTDTATLLQDSIGTMPVTAASQPVGLVLDQSRRGEEILIPQPAFNMSPSIARSGDVLTFASSAAGDQASAATSIINSTNVYRLKFTVTGTGSVVVYIGAEPSVFGAGSHDVPVWGANGAGNYIFRANTGGFNGTVAIEGLWELPGNHLIQSAYGKRPAYNGAGITPDGVDDFMQTAGNLDLTACDKLVVAMGYTKVDDVTRLEIQRDEIELGSGTQVGGQRQWFYSQGSSSPESTRIAHFTSNRANGYGAHIGRASIPANLGELWWNGVKGVDAVTTMGGGTFRNLPIYLLSRNGTSTFSNTPARRALVMGVPVAGTQVSDDDIELIRLWLMEGA